MLGFLRKHQKIFFGFIAAVIVVTFSFFGSYQGMSTPKMEDKEAFVAVNGKSIKRSQLRRMQAFLSSDSVDKMNFGGMMGPNFLNDGVIRHDILSGGLGALLVANYMDLVAKDLKVRFEREKRYVPYQHPTAPFLGAENAWKSFAPHINEKLAALREIDEPVSSEAFGARARLYLAEQSFPQPALKQVIRYQEQQFDWLKPDPYLERRDLSLFGYHTVDDWFGANFVTLVSEFVINASLLAEEAGYVVTKEEALADLMRNSEISFRQNSHSPEVTCANSREYLWDQLAVMGFSKNDAIDTWRTVLLFRRYFDDVGNAALVDSFPLRKFAAFAGEEVDADVYTFGIKLLTYRDLQRYEVYREAINGGNVRESAPELVHKRYHVKVAKAHTDGLRQRIPIKDVWDWQLDHFDLLTEQYPALASMGPKTRDERFSCLQDLDRNTRSRINKIAQDAIIKENPEWFYDACNDAEAEEMHLAVILKGGDDPLPGLTDRMGLIELLDGAPLLTELKPYSCDGEHYYAFLVIEKGGEAVMTFNEANEANAIDAALRRRYSEHYKAIREENPSLYTREDGTYKRLFEVQDQIADHLLADLLASAPTPADAAAMRFDGLMWTIFDDIRQHGEESPYIRKADDDPLEAQFKVVKTCETYQKSDLPIEEFSAGQWLKPQSGQIVRIRAVREGELTEVAKVDEARNLLAQEAERHLMRKLLETIKERDAISLAHIDDPNRSP